MSSRPLPFADRVELALSQLARRFVERDYFLSDSDLLDAAEAWTVDDLRADGYTDTTDYHALTEALDARVDVYIEEVVMTP